MIKKLYRF